NDGYIVGTGTGSTAEEAESHARVSAAAAISSHIKANQQALQTETTAGAEHSKSISVSNEIIQEVETDAGAFIQPVREMTVLIGHNYEAIAVADRGQLDEKYAKDAARTSEKLMLAWDRALTASKQANASAIVAALCDADVSEHALDKIDSERQLIARKG